MDKLIKDSKRNTIIVEVADMGELADLVAAAVLKGMTSKNLRDLAEAKELEEQPDPDKTARYRRGRRAEGGR